MIRPIRNQILVRPCPSDEVSEGGIIVPESIRERSSKAKVVAVGDGFKEPMRYRPGYTVWHVKGAGEKTSIEVDGETLYFIDATLNKNYILAYTEN